MAYSELLGQSPKVCERWRQVLRAACLKPSAAHGLRQGRSLVRVKPDVRHHAHEVLAVCGGGIGYNA
jgi:hypothetical protein